MQTLIIDDTKYVDLKENGVTFRFFLDDDDAVLSSMFDKNGQRIPVNMDAVPDDFWQEATRVLMAG